ncbi:MAG: stage II sporulation protein D [Bacillota bacterium]
MKKTLALTTLGLFLVLIILPAVLVRGLNLAAPRREQVRLGPAIPIDVFIVAENRIQRMDLEEYVKGVVAAEMPASFQMEALKAQAVIARTYAVLRMRVFGGPGCTHYPGADICTDHTRSQAWKSEAEMRQIWGAFNAGRWWRRIEQAVEDTAGLIVVYQGAPIDPVYHSTCGGATEASGNVWQQHLPYLVSVTCDWCRHSPHYRRTVEIPLSEVAARLGAVPAASPSSLFSVVTTSTTGRVMSVSTPAGLLKGTEFRSLLGLPSTRFTWEVVGTNLRFQVSGHGHGVGLCQYGADGLAKSGRGFLEIISFYYPGVTVRPLFDE